MKGVLNPEKIRSNGIAERVREFKVIEKREVERWKTRESDEHRKKKKKKNSTMETDRESGEHR